MLIERLEAEASAGLPVEAGVGACARATATHDDKQIEVMYRVNRHMQRVFTYCCDGARMKRETLSMLLCPEAACPSAQHVQRRWREFKGLPLRPASRRPVPLRARPLMEEIPVEAGGHRCVARPASFECLTPCLVAAHDPVPMRKLGWDLFEDGACVAGGLRLNEHSGASVPRFSTTQEAANWLMARHAVARSVLRQV